MSLISILSTHSTPTYCSGTPVRTTSPLRDLPEKTQEVATQLFKKFYAQYYPEEKENPLLYTFSSMIRYFEANITARKKNPVAERIEKNVLDALGIVTQKDETIAYKQLQLVTKKLAIHPESWLLFKRDQEHSEKFHEKFPELSQLLCEYQQAYNEIEFLEFKITVTPQDKIKANKQLQLITKKLVAYSENYTDIFLDILFKKYQENPKQIHKEFPELSRLLQEYSCARIIYDVTVNQWATSYLKTCSTRDTQRALSARIIAEIKAATPCWLLRLFGYNKTKLQMLDLRKKTLVQQRTPPKSTTSPSQSHRQGKVDLLINFLGNHKKSDIVALFNALVASKIPNIDIHCISIEDIYAIFNGSLDQYGLDPQVGLILQEFSDLLEKETDLSAAALTIQMNDHPWLVEINEENLSLALKTFNRLVNDQDLAICVSSKDQLLSYLQNPQLISASSIIRSRVIEQFQTEMKEKAHFRSHCVNSTSQQSAPSSQISKTKNVRWSDKAEKKPLATWKDIPLSEKDLKSRVTKERFQKGPLHQRKTGRHYSEENRSQWHYEGTLE